ncbi:MAG TPA: TetR/AcrR family transcriptional regulator [Caulobacteraceae bacterium]|jgi:AcrR family transcriptional regulator|nr:TetR/AcrR family transcriptional regulator [Caulobacteraceae bacterium]
MGSETLKKIDPDTRREAILDAAETVFLEVGFSAASMSMIAARVGGSKGTLYNYFKNKDDLFEAYVQRHCIWQQDAINALLEGEADLVDQLRGVGRKIVEVVATGFGLRNYILIAAEAHRAPQIGRAFFAAGPDRGTTRLAAFLEREMEAGRLRRADPLMAARHFIGACQNYLFKARLCNAVDEPTPEEIGAEVDDAVDAFLRAYAP